MSTGGGPVTPEGLLVLQLVACLAVSGTACAAGWLDVGSALWLLSALVAGVLLAWRR